MGVYKVESNNTWRVVVRLTNQFGEKIQTTKRGFSTKRDAVAWEAKYLAKNKPETTITFGDFYEYYIGDLQSKLKENTLLGKKSLIETRILPYFKNYRMCDIEEYHIMRWQNEMMSIKNGKGGGLFSPSYLKTLHNQLSAIFNHAVKFYHLDHNPAARVGNMGHEECKEMLIWTQDEYEKFAYVMMDDPMYYYAFEVLYWCGIREGELLALTKEDFNLEKGTLRINKSYQRLRGKDVITDPKTPKSNRIIVMPPFLVDEIRDYFSMLMANSTDRIFPITKYGLTHKMENGAKKAKVKRIRIHDLRHSHVSLLIELGYSAVAIAKRVGHESIDITYRYAHIFPSVQANMADDLDRIKCNEKQEGSYVEEERSAQPIQKHNNFIQSYRS